MTTISAKDLSDKAKKLQEQVASGRDSVKNLIKALSARNKDIADERRAKQEEQDRLERQSRMEDAVRGMNEAKSRKESIATAAETQPEAPVNTEKHAAAEERPAPAQSRPARPEGQAPRGPYGRPVPGTAPQQGARPAYNRPDGQQPRGPYGRTVNGTAPQQGARPAFNRPDGQAPRGPYGRPVPGKDAPQQGTRPQYGRPVPGKDAPQQGSRPMGQGRPGMGSKRPSASEIIPTSEKERVSNYDPKKNQYVRQNDPEHNKAKDKRSQSRSAAPAMNMDDEFERGGKRKAKKQVIAAPKPEPVKIEKAVMTGELITVKDLSEKIGKPVAEIIKKLFLLGIMATINQEIDYDTAQLVCSDYGIELEQKAAESAEAALEAEDVEDSEENLVTRPPVVTVMGHVDHGKTSLLDYIRSTRVTASEAGGITQHIGAYTVKVKDRTITFLDTPGHEAFTAMRARGAQATDIAILVVAADDGVMPQTIEAINHAKAAGVQTIVAITKMDKPTADPDRIRTELTKYDLVCEEWGGDTMMVPVSSKSGAGIDDLLESIIVLADVQDYKANPDRKARGVIIEARLDKGRGPVANCLIKNGTLRQGDTIIAGTAYGRVRAMVNDKGERIKEAGPSTPVEVIGFNDVPEAGDIISAVDDDSLSRRVAEERKDKARAALIKAQTKTTLDDLFSQISEGNLKELNIIIKADVQGSVEAVKQSIEKLSNDEVKVRAIHGGVGAITETDVMLASASNAIIVGFNVRHDNTVRDLAEREKVDIRLYRVIYDAIEDIEAAMKGMLAPKFKETVLGRCVVRQTFKVSGVGTIAGSYVTDGKIQRNAQIRLLRDNIVIHEGKIDSLKRFKDDAKEVAQGYECGIGIENYNDVKVGDEMECFIMEEVAQ